MKTCNQFSFFLVDRLTILLTPFRGNLKKKHKIFLVVENQQKTLFNV